MFSSSIVAPCSISQRVTACLSASVIPSMGAGRRAAAAGDQHHRYIVCRHRADEAQHPFNAEHTGFGGFVYAGWPPGVQFDSLQRSHAISRNIQQPADVAGHDILAREASSPAAIPAGFPAADHQQAAQSTKIKGTARNRELIPIATHSLVHESLGIDVRTAAVQIAMASSRKDAVIADRITARRAGFPFHAPGRSSRYAERTSYRSGETRISSSSKSSSHARFQRAASVSACVMSRAAP